MSLSKGAEWLPDTAFIGDRAAEPMARCIHEWSGSWCARGGISAAPPWKRLDHGADELDGYSLAAEREGFRLTARPEARLSLASALLGRSVSARDLRGPQDNELVDHLVKLALEDLADRLGLLITPLPAGSRIEEGSHAIYALPIYCGQLSCAMRMELRRERLARLVKQHCDAPRAGRAPASPAEAVRRLNVTLSAHIGTARLPFTQLDTLEIGDVLVLDRPASEALPARLDGKRAADEALRLHPAEDHFQFQIERPVSQW